MRRYCKTAVPYHGSLVELAARLASITFGELCVRIQKTVNALIEQAKRFAPEDYVVVGDSLGGLISVLIIPKGIPPFRVPFIGIEQSYHKSYDHFAQKEMKGEHIMLRRRIALGICAFLLGGFGVSAQAGEDIALDKLPQPVLDATKRTFPDAELQEAEREQEGGQLVYEVEVRVKGEKKEVDVTPEGKVIKVED